MSCHSKKWKAYCKTAFNSMKSNVDNWGDPDFFRPITRTFYINVFDCAGVNHTGLISENALKNPSSRTNDHCLSPQFIGRMIMDSPEVYLEDYHLFENLFWKACSTITVTKEENTSLSKLTKNDGIIYEVSIPTNLKYSHLGINLFQRPVNSNKWKDAIKYPAHFIDTPTDLLNYEKKFLIS